MGTNVHQDLTTAQTSSLKCSQFSVVCDSFHTERLLQFDFLNISQEGVFQVHRLLGLGGRLSVNFTRRNERHDFS